MNAFRQAPISRLLFPFIVGIILFEFGLIKDLTHPTAVLFTGVIFLLTFYFVRPFFSNWKLRWIPGFVLLPIMISIGGLTALVHEQSLFPGLQVQRGEEMVFEALVVDIPKSGKRSMGVEIAVISNEPGFRAMAYYPKGVDLRPGGRFISCASFDLIQPPRNPYAFDYRQFKKREGVKYQVFIKDMKVYPENDIDLKAHLLRIRSRLVGVFEKYLQGDELAIAAALVLGDKSHINEEVREAYAGAGAMHVLAVSGLHVGLVYLFLDLLLRFMDKRRSLMRWKLLMIILAIMAYAALTGFSPSVTRAAVMFSLIAIGRMIGRHSSIYNIIFASAFGMLLWDPNLLFNVSFQLSYIAVLGILYVYPLLFSLYCPQNKVGQYFWGLTCLSLSAQLSTFPLALYYFNLFPTWFLLTNLIIVPAATLILPGGFILLLLHYLAFGDLFAPVYKGVIYYSNQAMYGIENLPPGKLSSFLHLDELWLLYAFLVFTAVWFSQIKRSWMILSCSSLLLFVGACTKNQYKAAGSRGMSVFVDRDLLIGFHQNGEATLFGDSVLINNEKVLGYLVKGFYRHQGVTDINRVMFQDSVYSDGLVGFSRDVIEFNGQLVGIRTNNDPLAGDLDVLVLHGRVGSLEKVFNGHKVGRIVVSQGFAPWNKDNLLIKAKELGIPVWDCKEQGAFVLSANKKASV